MDRDTFLKKLAALESRFESLAPEVELTVRDPELDVEGYVVVWNTTASIDGPLGRCGKGGTRITPATSLDEIKMLARIMTLKNAAAGLPLGGAKSGMKADPDSPGFEKRYRRWVQLVKPALKEFGGLYGGFGFDIGARPVHPMWACDELKSLKSFTGKPVAMGGTDYDKEGIAGLGVAVAAKTLVERKNESATALRYGVQGIGAMGAAVIRNMTEYGAELSHVSDPRIGGSFEFLSPPSSELLTAIAEMDIPAVQTLLKQAKTKPFPLDEILFAKTDIMFPCAIQGVLNRENSGKVQARYLVEGANNPCNDEAHTVFHQRGIFVVPDFIANPGGIIAAFIEMSSKITPEENERTRANVHDSKALTRSKIAENVSRMVTISSELNVEPTAAGRFLALQRVFPDSQ